MCSATELAGWQRDRDTLTVPRWIINFEDARISGRRTQLERHLTTRKDEGAVSENYGDFQLSVYADAVKGVNSRFPFDARSIERKAAEALPHWVYRYVSAAAGDGRTQQANIDAYSHYGIIPRMMISPPQRDLSIDLFGKHLNSPIFMCPIGPIGLCSPDFQGDVAAARASAATVCRSRCRRSPRRRWRR